MENLKEYFEKWKPHLKESRLHEDVLTPDDVAWLLDFMFRKHHRVKPKDSGTILFLLDQPGYRAIYEHFEQKFRQLVPDFDDCFFDGNFYMARMTYNVHTDCGMPEHMADFNYEIMPYRQFVIPLLCQPGAKADERSGIVTFKQRSLDFGTIFCQGFKGMVKGAWNDIYDHSDREFYTLDGRTTKYSGKPFDREFYDKWLDYYPYENLNDLEVENFFPYKIGSIIEIDACQLHGVTNFRKFGVHSRTGLAFNLFKKL